MMYRPPICIEHVLVHHLAERRVRENHVHQVRLGCLELPRHRIALDQLGDVGPDDRGFIFHS